MAQDTEVMAKGSVADFSDFDLMFAEMEATGKVTLSAPDPNAEEDTALLNWLRSGFHES